MANCHVCDNLSICPWASPEEIICSSFKRKPITNADRIRAMTDEELAEFITPVKCVDCHLLDCGVGEIGNDKTCEERILDWLRQEVSE